MAIWYRTGTVTVTNGSTTVTGASTSFVGSINANDAFQAPDGRSYEIASVDGATQFTLATAYLGATASGQSYSIMPTRGVTVDLLGAVNTLITNVQDTIDNAGAGKFANGTASAPSLRGVSDQDSGINFLNANAPQFVAGGAVVGTWTTTGLNAMAVGATTRSTGAFTTLSASGLTSLTGSLAVTGDIYGGSTGGTTIIAGGNSATDGARLELHGSASSGFASDMFIRSPGGAAMWFDYSTGNWTWYNELGEEQVFLNSDVRLIPWNDNDLKLGDAAARWSTVYAATGAINTSDAREKTAVTRMAAPDHSAALDLVGQIGRFQWLESVEKKGKAARYHTGLTVQAAIEILERHGIDPMAQAFICHDAWQAEDGRPGGDRYSFRTDQLALFMIAGLAAEIDALSARINA